MIVADIQSVIGLMVAILMLCFAIAGFGVGMIARAVFRQVRDGYRKDGGVKGLAQKVATKGVAMLVRRAIFKKR